MNYTASEIIQFVEEEDVKFIRLGFCDIYGKQKNISIMPTELERAFERGIAFDASAVTGFECPGHPDLFLHPDPNTLTILPWRPEHGRVVRMYCTITFSDGTPFDRDARSLLKDAVAKAREAGVSFFFGSEIEFYLFKLDDNGVATSQPYDNAGFMDIAPEDRGENVRREICLTLEQMGIRPESSHHEAGPGQNEIDFRYSDPLTSADNAITFKSVVGVVASRNGLAADFSPKPIIGRPGNGMHINFSVKSSDGRELLPSVIAGILKHLPEMSLFLNPVEASYARLADLPIRRAVSWTKESHSHLVRIPASDSAGIRAELSSPDPLANPYLAYTLLIYAGLDGIKKGLELPPAADASLGTSANVLSSGSGMLPASLKEASTAAASSSFIAESLPAEMINVYKL